jgi:uncharacterized protein YjbI with pentapeptide repeats
MCAGALFARCELTYADFSHADLTRADMAGASMFRAKLHSAKLDGARITDRVRTLGDEPELAEAERWQPTEVAFHNPDGA